MSPTFEALIATAHGGALDMSERPNDPYRSFLEATIEAAIVRHLPGRAETSQQRRRFDIPGFDPAPYGVDIDWRCDGVHAGIGTKASDVQDSLFDVIKLAAAIFHQRLDERFCAIAALARHWAATNPVCAMAAAPAGAWQSWDVEELLAAPAARGAVLVATGPRPSKFSGRSRR